MHGQSNLPAQLATLLDRLQNVKRSGDGWSARCPAHEDHNNSLSIVEGQDGRVLLNCFAGCDVQGIVAAVDLQMRDLFPTDDSQSSQTSHGHRKSIAISLKDLAVDKELPLSFLSELGLSNRHDGVVIPYKLKDGSLAPRQRLRTALRAKDGSIWLFGKGRPVPYGLWRRDDAVNAGYAALVEGESDCWTAWFHEIPALGIPGATMARTLRAEHVKGIGKLYVVKEPDQGGERFVAGIASRLGAIEWEGEAYVVTLPEGIKDLNALHKASPQGFMEALDDALKSAERLPLTKPSTGSDKKSGPSSSQNDPVHTELLLELAEEMELFHDPNKDPFASFHVGEHVETWPIRGRPFRRFLARAFYQSAGRPPNPQTLKSALAILEAIATFDGPELPTFIRLAEHEGRTYLDLSNDLWQAVEVTAIGFRVVSEPPVKFLRTRGMRPLPHPRLGGSIDELRRFLNVGGDSDWHLMLSWLVANLRPRGPYPVLVLNGQHGSAKSTAIEVLRSFCDPNTVPLRAEPRNVRDLMIAATNSWCLCLDNVSHLKPWISDAICRLSTGGGFSTRALFTDAEEMLFDAQRPVALNGIEEIATRSDLLDRCLVVSLPEIPDDKRIDEQRFTLDLEEARPRILGALLKAVCAGIRNLPTVQLTRTPRMADFAHWITAVEPALGWSPGTFMTSYLGNRKNVNQLALEASPVAIAVLELKHFDGTASDLLQELEAHVRESVRKQNEWPKNARALSGALRRIAPNLRAIGVDVTFAREDTARRRRLISIKRTTSSTVHTVHTVQAAGQPESNTPGINELRCPRPLDANQVEPDANRQAVDAMSDIKDARRTEPSSPEILPVQQLDDVDGLDAKIPVSPSQAPEDSSLNPSEAAVPVGSAEDDWETIE